MILGGERFVKEIEPLEGSASFRCRDGRGSLPGRPWRSCSLRLGTGEERDAQIYKAVVGHGYRLREVGECLGLHYSTVIWIVGKQESKVKT